MRRVVSVWLPAWPIERMRRHTPSAVPDDRPLALVLSGSHGLRITAVNAPAATEGIRPGLPLADARAALPALLSRPAEPARDRRALLKLARWSGRYGPSRHREGEDGFWIDVTGIAHLFGGEDKLLADLLRRLQGFGLTARAAMAGTHGTAHALARFSRGQASSVIAPQGGERAALAPLPVEALRIAPEAALLLRRLGLKHIGDLYDLPRPALERRFRADKKSKAATRAAPDLATAVLFRLDQALGIRDELRRPLAEPPLLEVRRTWSEPLISHELILSEIESLAKELCLSLKKKQLGARRLALSLWRSDGSIAPIAIGLSAPSADPSHIMRLLVEKLGTLDAGFGIDVAALAAVEAHRLGARQSTLDKGTQKPTDGLALLTDRLASRLGTARIACLVPGESHIPERAERRMGAMTALSGMLRTPSREAQRTPLRPALVLTPPEPIAVMAEVPEGPPRQFTWRRLHHRVVKSEGPERIAPEWWRGLKPAAAAAPEATAETDASGLPPVMPRPAPRPRDYYRLEDETGACFWVFREGLYQNAEEEGSPRWLMHGIFG